jgi:stress response protein SCP2/tellurite resistance protein
MVWSKMSSSPSPIPLSKGLAVPLESLASAAEIGAALTITLLCPGHQLDMIALLLDVNDSVRSDDDLVFFNHIASADDAVRLADLGEVSQTFELDLHKVAPNVVRIVFGAAGPLLDSPGACNLAVSLGVRGRTIAQTSFAADPLHHSVLLLEVYRRQGDWRCRVLADGYAGGLEALIGAFGVDVDDSSQADQTAALPPATTTPTFSLPEQGAAWVARDQTVAVGDQLIVGGWFWIGGEIVGRDNISEPSLIDPRLPSSAGGGARVVDEYVGSYADMSPTARSQYLSWLATDRRSTDAPAAFVELYFCGIERRVASLLTHASSSADELTLLRKEIVGIGARYTDFARYSIDAQGLLGVVDAALTNVSVPSEAPARVDPHWQVPESLRAGLGCIAESGRRLPADWALSWLWYHPNIYARTAQTRCQHEFEHLFTLRYDAKLTNGVKLRWTESDLLLRYSPVNWSLNSIDFVLKGVPDVFDQEYSVDTLDRMREEVNADLDAYSRFLGRSPDSAGTLAAAALLPSELLAEYGGPEIEAVRRWAEFALADHELIVLNSTELIAKWPAESFGKAEATSLAALLQRLGYGIEPDVRFGEPKLDGGPMVLFRAVPGTPASGGSTWSAATLFAHLGVAVAVADNHIDPRELQQITQQLDTAFTLTEAEHGRLRAHMAWLGATGVDLKGLKRRLEPLALAQRESIADFVALVAAADGMIVASEVKAVERIHALLGLDPTQAAGRLHRAMTMSGPPPAATEPVTIREAPPVDRGYAIPPPPQFSTVEPPRSYPVRDPVANPIPGAVRLDHDAIMAKMADSAAVSALLASIFVDDDDLGDEMSIHASPPMIGNEVAGLDAAHSAMLRQIALRPSWTRSEFEQLTESLSLLPDAALERLNDASVEVSDDLVLDGIEILHVNRDVLQEMLA